MNKIFKKIFLPILICLSIISTSIISIAAGDGSGGGGGKSIPLIVKETSISDGAKNIPLDVDILFTFTKNIAHEDVRDFNKTQFKMVSEDGKEVPIEVRNADIQMEPEKRRDLTVVPKEKLKEGTTYKITTKKGIKSKGGQFTESDKTISFTTAGQKPIKKEEAKPVEVKKEEVKKDEILEEKIEEVKDEVKEIEETKEEKLEPLKLESTNPEDGAVDIDIDSLILFTFEKNVSNKEVKDENIKLFTMTKENGEEVEIEVTVEDDEISPENKREIKIKPKNPLEEETKYTITALKGIKSKGGQVTEEDYSISFTTGKKAVEKEIEPVEIKEETKNNKGKYLIGGLAVALLIGGGYIYQRRKEEK